MTEQEAIAEVVLNTPYPDRFVDCGKSRPLPMFHMATLMQYGEQCANAAIDHLRSQSEPFEIDWPEYHAEAMGCGLEDRGITDRYEAMRYGWDEAMERVAERLPEQLYLAPVAKVPAMYAAGDDTFVPTYTGTPVSDPATVYHAMLAAAPEYKEE